MSLFGGVSRKEFTEHVERAAHRLQGIFNSLDSKTKRQLRLEERCNKLEDRIAVLEAKHEHKKGGKKQWKKQGKASTRLQASARSATSSYS